MGIFLVIILLVYTFLGMQRGFIVSLFDFCKYIAAFILTIILYKVFARIVCDIIVIDGLPLDQHFIKIFREKLESLGGLFTAAPDGYNTENVAAGLKDAGIPTFFANILNPIIVNALSGLETGISNIVATFVVNTTIYILSFILLFIILVVVCITIGNILSEDIKKNKYTATVDKTLGTAFGFVHGLCVIWLALAFIGFTSGILPFLQGWVDDSGLATFLQNNNLILLIIKGTFNINSMLGLS